MQKCVDSVNSYNLTNNVYCASRVVCNSSSLNGTSCNWKADWARFIGKSYAQVVGSNLAKAKVMAQHISDNTNNSSVVETETCKPTNQTQPTFLTQKKVSVGNSSDRSQISSRRYPKNGQIHASDFHIPLHNRFQSIQLPDTTHPTIRPSQNKVILKTPVHKQSTKCTKVSDDNVRLWHSADNNETITQCNTPNREHRKCQKHQKLGSKISLPQDKYELALQVKKKNKDKIQLANSDPTFQKWAEQNPDNFGYIPLGPLLLPKTDKKKFRGTDPVKLYDITKNENTFNFMHSQIQVKSQLNPDIWATLLEGYWDKQLLYLIRYGFPLDFDKNSKLAKNSDNHKSALMFPTDIDQYLTEEMEFGAIVGPFSEPPLTNFHTSPFMTREKPGGDHRRVIMDLSFPHGLAVNSKISKDSYLGTDFILTLPSIDHITNKVKKFGKGSLLYKIDISRAFRHVKIDPRDYFLLGLKHRNYFFDTCLPFGYRHGSGIFSRLSDAVRFMMKNMGHDVVNYIDDVIGFGTASTATPSYKALYQLLQDLGFDISTKKLVQPSTKAICLGVEINTENFTVSVPLQKLENISRMCESWKNRTKCTKKELQSLLGSLLYISKCVKNSRFFLNRMLDTLRAHFGTDTIKLNQNFHRDLNWFLKFLQQFNGTAFFNHAPVHMTIELDACLVGLGAICMNQVYAIQIPKNFENYSIVHLEMLNILVALRVWAKQWSNKKILLKCDNQAVVSVLNSGKTQDLTLAAMARNINMLLAVEDIELQVIHILGVDNNIADLLSRWSITSNPDVKLRQLVKNPLWLTLPNDILNLDWSI